MATKLTYEEAARIDEWLERVPTLSIHPEMATIRDVEKMAAHIMELRRDRLLLIQERDAAIASNQEAATAAER